MHASASTLARAPSAIRRLALTTKQTNAGFYKGNRTGTIGWHTKYGGFRIDWLRVRTYVVPEGLDKFDVRGPEKHIQVAIYVRVLTCCGEDSCHRMSPRS